MSLVDPEPARNRGGAVATLGGAVAASGTGSLGVFLTVSLAVQIRSSLHFGATELGIAVACYYAGAAVGSIPSGRLVEAVGGARVMRWAAVACAVVLALVATSARSWVLLAGLLLLAGVIAAGMQNATNLYLARRIPGARQGLAFGIKQAAVPMTTILGGLAVPAIALTVGWRWAFAGGAVLALAAACAVPAPRTSLAVRRSQTSTLRSDPPLRPLVILAFGFGLGVFAASGLTTFFVTGAVAGGMSKGTAGLLFATAGAIAAGSRIVTGAFSDRRVGGHLRVVALMLLVAVGGYVTLALGSTFRTTWLYAIGGAVTFAFGWGWNGLFNFTVVSTHPDAPARATSITQTGARMAGIVGPIVFGLLVDHFSYLTAWLVAGGATVCAATIMLLGHVMAQRAPSSPDAPLGPTPMSPPAPGPEPY